MQQSISDTDAHAAHGWLKTSLLAGLGAAALAAVIIFSPWRSLSLIAGIFAIVVIVVLLHNPLRRYFRVGCVLAGSAGVTGISPDVTAKLSLSPTQTAEFILEHSGTACLAMLALAGLCFVLDYLYTRPKPTPSQPAPGAPSSVPTAPTATTQSTTTQSATTGGMNFNATGGSFNFYSAASPSPQPTPATTTAAPHKAIRHNLPPLTRRYVARPDEIVKVHGILTSAAPSGVSLVAAYRGHGGQGKSTLALAYAWACVEAGTEYSGTYPGGCFWVSAAGGSIAAGMAALAATLGLPVPADTLKAAELVRNHLKGSQPSLLILDNIDKEAVWLDAGLQALLPHGHCRHLITTRTRGLAGVEEVPVGFLTGPQAVEVLNKYRPIGADAAEQEAAVAIANHLGGLAAAVAAVGAYMRKPPPKSYAAYWNALKIKPVQEYPGGDPATALETLYERRAAVVIDDALDTLPPPQRRAVEYAALLPPDIVPAPWLVVLLAEDSSAGLESIEGAIERPELAVVRELLADGVLTKTDESGNLLSLHRLWHARVNERAEAKRVNRTPLLVAIAACAASRRAGVIGIHEPGKARPIDNPRVLTDNSRRWELTPLIGVVLLLTKAGLLQEAAIVTLWLASPLNLLGRLREARAVLDGLLVGAEAAQTALGDSVFASLLNDLAMIQQAQGDLPAARTSMERAIAIEQRHSAPDHPTLAYGYSNLGLIQKNQADFPAARASIERAIDIQQKHFAPDHPTLGTSYSNLALVQLAQEDLSAARASMERAMVIQQKHFAPDHPNFGRIYTNLAGLCGAEGDHAAACANFNKALVIFLKHFDENHPNVKLVRRLMKDAGCGG